MNFATLLRDLMCEQGTSGRTLAGQVPCDQGLISKLACGKQHPSERIASRLDDLLGADGKLIEAARADRAVARRLAAWRPFGDDADNDDVNRRDMLAVLMGGPFALELERIRQALDGVSPVPASERDADEWERVAALYAGQVACSPHARYLPHLLADMTGLADWLGVPHHVFTNMSPTIYGGPESLPAQSAEHLRTRKVFTGCHAGHTFFHVDPHGRASICKVGRDPNVDLMADGLEGLARLGGIADSLMLRTGGCSGCQLSGSCTVCRPLARLYQQAKAPLASYCQHGQREGR